MLAFVLLSLTFPWSARATECEQEKRSVPEDAAVRDADKALRDLLKDEYAKKTPADKRALAKTLLVQGREPANAPPTQYAALLQAVDLSVQAADVETCQMAMAELFKSFNVDVVAQRTPALAALAKAVKTSEEIKSVSKAYLQLADDAVAVDRYEDAAKAIEAAVAQAKRAKDLAAVLSADAKSKDVAAKKIRFEKIRQAKDTLLATPDDPAANLAVGQYLCFAKEDWTAGLALLGKGPDGALKAAALKDRVNPQSPADRMAVGDGWWEIAETAAAEDKFPLHDRAGHWYLQAQPKLAGLEQKKIEQRLNLVNGERLGRGNWVDLKDPALLGQPGKPGDPIEITVPTGGRDVTLNSKPFPPGEYDALQVRVRFKGKGEAHVAYNGPGYPKYADLHLRSTEGKLYLPGDTWPIGFIYVGPLPELDEYLITVVNKSGKDICYFNGQEIRRWPNPQDHFDQLRLHTSAGTVVYDKIRIRKR